MPNSSSKGYHKPDSENRAMAPLDDQTFRSIGWYMGGCNEARMTMRLTFW